jgi:hypothetical protein
MGSVGRTPDDCHSGLGSGVHALQIRSIYSYTASSDVDMSPDSFVLMFWDFYLPPIVESMVRRGCSRLEERGSIYLVDPIAIIEVLGEEVLASTLDRSRLWRRCPG